MTDVCIITGGGGAMGLVAAKRMGQDGIKIVLADNSQESLDAGIKVLTDLGIDAAGCKTDCTNQDECNALAAFAATQGTVKYLLNLAGISPKVAPELEDKIDGKLVFDVACLGTIYTSTACFEVMDEGGCVINIASASPFLVPPGSLSDELYPMAIEDLEGFKNAVYEVINKEENMQSSRNKAYMIARNFNMWYSEVCACAEGRKNIRVLSVAPGVVDGPQVEESGLALANMSALGRTGTPDEMAEAYAFLFSDKASYITGTNIMCDGGIVAAIHTRKR